MSDPESPQPFRRARNLSNRNFAKRNSNRCLSNDSRKSSVDSHNEQSSSITTKAVTASTDNTDIDPVATEVNSSSSSMQCSYSVNTDNAEHSQLQAVEKDNEEPPVESDPALMDVKQKVLRFETLQAEDRIIFKTGKYKSKLSQPHQSYQTYSAEPLRLLPLSGSPKPSGSAAAAETPSSSTRSSVHISISEERSEDEVDDISDYAEDAEQVAGAAKIPCGEYVLPELAQEVKEDVSLSSVAGLVAVPHGDAMSGIVTALDDIDSAQVDIVARSMSVATEASTLPPTILHSSESTPAVSQMTKKANKDFPRNYRSTPRPKTEIISTKNRQLLSKYNSLYQADDDGEDDEIELRDKSVKFIHPILDELIKTEETYVENLLVGIENYGNIFDRSDLPIGLRGKKYVLLGNIEQIAEFHRDEFLPMLYRNRRDLKRLFDEFQLVIDENCFYGYVIFTMNKQRSLKLCDVYKNYFKLIQGELDDKLGINSFLVQPIQRMARYPLLLQQFISTLFKNRDYVMKPLIESCCRLEKKVRTLLTTTNESEIINDIVDCHEFNVFYQGKFRRVSEFHVMDHTLKRSYRSKVFIFDKCIIYTEIKGKQLVFHGRYPCEHIGIIAKTKSFTLFYERRKQQECEFSADPALIESWLELIRDMITSFVNEERQKLQERYSRENDHLHRKPPSLSLFRDSNRFSSDSGIGNIWVMPKPEVDSEAANHRTTWYAVS